MTNTEMKRQAKEKAKEIYFTMLNAGKGFISDYCALECAFVTVEHLLTEASDGVPKKGERYMFYKFVYMELKILGNRK